MRSTLVLLLFISLPAWACPELSGFYQSCRSSASGPEASTLKVEQKLLNKVHQFTFTTAEESEKYLADGKARSVTDTDSDTGIVVKSTTSAACTSSALIIKMKITMAGEALADIAIQSSKNGNQLVQVYTGTSMGEEVNETITCE